MDKHTLHVVTFQVPYPPRYGGLIDVYYKIEALHRESNSVQLHTFYRALSDVTACTFCGNTERVFFYKRHTGLASFFSSLPYIIYSRRDTRLLEDLCADNAPILFEGIHTCYHLDSPLLRDRKKWVRMHNVEHEYYRGLARATRSWWKRIYYLLEAHRLEKAEKLLCHADGILAVTKADAEYFTRRFPQVEVRWLPCFYDTSLPTGPALIEGKYVLYHGNLSVAENAEAAEYIVRELMPRLPAEVRVVVAGLNPDARLRRLAEETPGVSLWPNPSPAEMDALIAHAHVHLLLTNLRAGIKLKLLHVLSKAHGYLLAGDKMLPDDEIRKMCIVANRPDEQVEKILSLLVLSLPEGEPDHRRRRLQELGYGNSLANFPQLYEKS